MKSTRCFAAGGKVDPEQLLRDMQAKYGGAPAPQDAPAAAPSALSVQAPKAPEGGLLQRASSLLKGRQAQIDKAVGYAQGGKIVGPGTSTSDSIPAQVKETGENIFVSNDERIVSAEQDAILERIAQMLGFESVDTMFASLTGKPVGPTLKGGKSKAFSLGGLPGSDNDLTRANQMGAAAERMRKERTAVPPVSPVASGLQSTRVGAVTQNNLQQDPINTLTNQVDIGRAVENSNLTMTEKAALGMGTSSAAASEMRKKTDALASLRDGIAAQQQPNTDSAWIGGGNGDPLNQTWSRAFATGGVPRVDEENPSPMEKYNVKTFRPSLLPSVEQKADFAAKVADFKQQHGAPVKAAQPVVQRTPTQAAASVSPIPETPMMTPPGAVPTEAPQEKVSPMIAGTATMGGKTISLPATPMKGEGYVDAQGNPVQKWEQTARYAEAMNVNKGMADLLKKMERWNAERDTRSDITNPGVVASAEKRLARMDNAEEAAQRGQVLNVQAQTAQQQLETQKQAAALQGEFLDPKTTPERRKQLTEMWAALHGKADDGKYTMHVVNSVDPTTGQPAGQRVVRMQNRTGQVDDVTNGTHSVPAKIDIKVGMPVNAPDGTHTFQGRSVTVLKGKVTGVK